MAQTEIRHVWESRIAAYKSSGLSISKWCAVHQVSRHQFYYWMRKLQNVEDSTAQWIALDVHLQPAIKMDATLIVRIGSATIEVKPGFDRNLLSDVVQTLQALC